jgi:hypothetical protein
MAADASQRGAQQAAAGTGTGTGTRVHNRGFSSDMRQTSPEDGSKQKEQRIKDKDRKEMLNKALQKAHTAVLLDNAYNYEGAIDAYRDACSLLQQVLIMSTADEERYKLEQIVRFSKSWHVSCCCFILTDRL